MSSEQLLGPAEISLANLCRNNRARQLIEVANSLTYRGYRSMAIDGTPGSAGSVLAELLNRTGVKHEITPQADDQTALLAAALCVNDMVALVPQSIIDEHPLAVQTILARVDIPYGESTIAMGVVAGV